MQWRRKQRGGLRQLQESYASLYQRTEQFRVYSSTVIPGFVQTPAYAHALMEKVARIHGTVDDIEAAVQARMARSQIVHEKARQFSILIEESVLRNIIGDPEIMVEQLQYLLKAMAFRLVAIGIVPANAVRTMWTLETYNMFDNAYVHIELLTAQITVTAPGEIAQYANVFSEMAGRARTGAAARSLINAAISELSKSCAIP